MGEDGKNTHRPVVIHRGVISTMERFSAYLIGRNLRCISYMKLHQNRLNLHLYQTSTMIMHMRLKRNCRQKKLRVVVDDRAEKIGYKIRARTKNSIHVVLAKTEIPTNVYRLEIRAKGDLGQMSIDKFAVLISDELSGVIA